MVFFSYFLSSPCVWIKLMIIEKCQCLYNGNFAFGNVLNVHHVKLMVFRQPEHLRLLTCCGILSLVKKRQKPKNRLLGWAQRFDIYFRALNLYFSSSNKYYPCFSKLHFLFMMSLSFMALLPYHHFTTIVQSLEINQIDTIHSPHYFIYIKRITSWLEKINCFRRAESWCCSNSLPDNLHSFS